MPPSTTPAGPPPGAAEREHLLPLAQPPVLGPALAPPPPAQAGHAAAAVVEEPAEATGVAGDGLRRLVVHLLSQREAGEEAQGAVLQGDWNGLQVVDRERNARTDGCWSVFFC
jgi:hypothetical protein